ncbi:MAG: hypothetical protein NVSMB65_08310 [Chloroflexota bacterium]
MSPRTRRQVFVVGAAGFALVLLWGMHGLPAFGHYHGPYGDVLNRAAPRQRHISNIVTAVNYDYRGVDTMGEEFILFTSVVGVALLLRAQSGEVQTEVSDAAPGRQVPAPSEAVRAIGSGALGCIALLGIYIILHGHLTPGGGFQGGSVVASAWVLAYGAGRYATLRRMSPEPVIDAIDAAGAAAYVLIGLATLLAGLSFLYNALPQGSLGDLLSSGTIWLINAGVGVEVAAGLIVVIAEFLKQALELRREERGGPEARTR